jgi:hypothetical protein
MVYLDALPFLLVFVSISTAATLLSRFTTKGRPLFPYLWRALLASTTGILAANTFLWGMVIAIGSVLTAMDPLDQVPQHLFLPRIVEYVLQPVPMSALGAAAGLAVGVAWTIRVTRPPQPHPRPRLAA